MYKTLNAALVALGLAGASLTAASPAIARKDISFDVGNVAFGYQDGYWDQGHHWHHWHNRREARYYRSTQGNHYNNYRHDRDNDNGWHR